MRATAALTRKAACASFETPLRVLLIRMTFVETDMNRFACCRWQTRQNPRTFRHGGRELRCLRMIWIDQP
jgi:hypothetical protein